METPDTPPSKRSLFRRLKSWLKSEDETPAVQRTTELPMHEPVVEMPANPTESVLTQEIAPAVDDQTVHTQKSPVAAPKAVRKKRAATAKTKKEPVVKEEKKSLPKNASTKDLLDVLPAETNLIGRAPVEIMLSGKKHVLAFRNEHIILDGHNYHINKGSVTLDIEDAKRIGSHLDLIIGAFGKTETLVFDAEDMEEIISTLLIHGTYKNEDKDLVITRF